MKKNKSKIRGVAGTLSDDDFGDYAGLSSDDDKSDDVLSKLNYDSDSSSSEEEVFAVHSESDLEDEIEDEGDDDANISESDINDPDDDLPDPKAWGKHKKSYYNADNINDKINLQNEEDEEAAKMEEEEAKAIQKRLIAKIDDADLAFDLLDDVMLETEKTESDSQGEKIEVDLSQMNEQEKIQLLKKELPNLLTYIEDYKVLTLCVRDELLPVSKLLKDNKLEQSGPSQFIKLYSQLIMNYCTNIVFYVMLKLRKVDTKSHPCSKWLSQYKSMVEEAKPTYEQVFKPQIKLITEGDLKSVSHAIRKRKWTEKNNPTGKQMKMSEVDTTSTYFMNDEKSAADVYDETRDGETDGKRPITYQIAKNKGLTPHRKKELRNPRVKHRMKYRKAKIRRKGQVREVRKEVRKYDGEISGIKANVVKSIKFKSKF